MRTVGIVPAQRGESETGWRVDVSAINPNKLFSFVDAGRVLKGKGKNRPPPSRPLDSSFNSPLSVGDAAQSCNAATGASTQRRRSWMLLKAAMLQRAPLVDAAQSCNAATGASTQRRRSWLLLWCCAPPAGASTQRRWSKVPVREGVGSNPTVVIIFAGMTNQNRFFTPHCKACCVLQLQ